MIVFLCLLFYYLNENNILYTNTHNIYACSRYLKNIYNIIYNLFNGRLLLKKKVRRLWECGFRFWGYLREQWTNNHKMSVQKSHQQLKITKENVFEIFLEIFVCVSIFCWTWTFFVWWICFIMLPRATHSSLFVFCSLSISSFFPFFMCHDYFIASNVNF